jgi:hypothetical protein
MKDGVEGEGGRDEDHGDDDDDQRQLRVNEVQPALLGSTKLV